MSGDYVYIEYKTHQLAIPYSMKNTLLQGINLVDRVLDRLLDTKITNVLLVNPYSLHFNRSKIFAEWTEQDFLELLEIISEIYNDATVKLYIPSVVIEFWMTSTEYYILLYNTVVSQSGKTISDEDLGSIITEYITNRHICDYSFVYGVPGEHVFMLHRRVYVLCLDGIVRNALIGPDTSLSGESPLRSKAQNDELRMYGRYAIKNAWHEFLDKYIDIFNRNCSWPAVVKKRLTKLSRADYATVLAGKKIPFDHFTWD